MKIELHNDVFVLFGAAGGIGRAIAQGFLEAGARGVVTDVNPAISEVARSLASAVPGATARAEVADVLDQAAVDRLAEQTVAEFGRVDHVVFAAAIGSGKFGQPFWKLEPDDWDRVWAVNVKGAVIAAHAFAPRLAEARRGTLTLLASVSGQIGSPSDPPYSAAKAAVINFGQCAARDLAPFGVRVNTICPGMVDTPLNRSVHRAWAESVPASERVDWESWSAEKIARTVPLNRWQTPEDIAAMAVFLASEQARNITGQTLNVDGGFVMHW